MESKLEKLENWKIKKLTRRCGAKVRRSCASRSLKDSGDAIVKEHAILADVEEEEQDVIFFDDIIGKELPWHAVRKARELELKYLRDLGVYEKIDEKEAVAQYRINPLDTKWVDTDKAFEGEPMQIRSRFVARELKSDDRPDLYVGTPPLEVLKATVSIAANHKEMFHSCTSTYHVHTSTRRPRDQC